MSPVIILLYNITYIYIYNYIYIYILVTVHSSYLFIVDVVARLMHFTSELAMTVLSKCVCCVCDVMCVMCVMCVCVCVWRVWCVWCVWCGCVCVCDVCDVCVCDTCDLWVCVCVCLFMFVFMACVQAMLHICVLTSLFVSWPYHRLDCWRSASGTIPQVVRNDLLPQASQGDTAGALRKFHFSFLRSLRSWKMWTIGEMFSSWVMTPDMFPLLMCWQTSNLNSFDVPFGPRTGEASDGPSFSAGGLTWLFWEAWFKRGKTRSRQLWKLINL